MPDSSPYTLSDLDEALDPSFMRGAMALGFSMIVSPLIWLGLGLYTSHQAPPTNGGEGPTVLAGVLAILGAAIVTLAGPFMEGVDRRADLASYLEHGLQQGRGGRITGRIPILQVLLRRHHLIRMALNETVGIFGLLVSFLAGHLLWERPLWMLSMAACVLACALNALLWPTKDFYRSLFRRTLEGRP